MTKTNTLKARILEAAAAGKLTLAQIDGGQDFESVVDWLEYSPSEDEMADALKAAGLYTEADRAADWTAADEGYERQRASEAKIANYAAPHWKQKF